MRRHDYGAFGEAATPLAGADARRFTGKERDAETGLDYFASRYYRAAAGRFTTVDPLMGTETALVDPQRWNRYSYAGNRPTRIVDPDGRGWLSVLAKSAKVAIKGGSLAAEFEGVVKDVETIVDSNASVGDKVFAIVSLASEVASPVSLGDAKSVVSFAARRGDEASKSIESAGRILSRSARTLADPQEVYRRLEKYHGIDSKTASDRLHAIKKNAGLGGRDNVVFDRTGNVFDQAGNWLGTLTEGGGS